MEEPGTVKTSMLYNTQPIKKCNTQVITDIKHGAIVFIKKYIIVNMPIQGRNAQSM